jgi:hypothetical protein
MPDSKYLETFLTPLRECAKYKPQLGGQADEGVSAADFIRLYSNDPLYNWVGLNSGSMYAAHKAAGGITSIYRQLGIGCERLVRQVIGDSLELLPEQLKWSYDVEKEDGSRGTLTLDARISVEDLQNQQHQTRLKAWLLAAGADLGLSAEKSSSLRGAVFEVRQGYKSADSKRQNADLRSALRAYSENLLPIVMVVSSQINQTVLRRYRSAHINILVGTWEGPATRNTFSFFSEVVGYDLKGFFERNQAVLRAQVESIVGTLLTTE